MRTQLLPHRTLSTIASKVEVGQSEHGPSSRICYQLSEILLQPSPAYNWQLRPGQEARHSQPDTKRPGQEFRHPQSTVRKTPLLFCLINSFLCVSCILLLLSYSLYSMSEDDGSPLDAIRREQQTVIDEVQEIKDTLLSKSDDPDYGSLDCRELEDLDAELGALLKMGSRHKGKLLAEELDEGVKVEDSKQWKTLQQSVSQSKVICRRLIATREFYGKLQTSDKILSQLKARRIDFPNKDYTLPVRRISDKVTDLLDTLESSTLPPDHKLRTLAMELEISLEDMEIVDIILTPDSKPTIKDKPQPPKMQAIAPPTFSGLQRDWQSFWTAFRDIHECSKYSASAKLAYLRQAQKDPSLHDQLCQNVANGDSYEEVVAGLLDQFDRPREDHRIYLENITKMQPVKATRSSLMACATTLQSSIDGLTRLSQLDAHSIFTTLVEPLLPDKVKSQWEEATVDKKQVPPVKELITFLRKRAAMPQFADKPQPYVPAERKPSKHQQQSRHKGSVHVASTAPASATTQPTESKSNTTTSTPRPSSPSKSMPYKPKTSAFPMCKYSCPLCKEAHYAWGCATFKERTLAQRKEHVQRHNLCTNCLKPGHSQADCKSRFSCQTCQERHNTLLHSGGNAPATVGMVNHISNNTSTNSLTKAKLLMTCEVLITGPTGKSMPVRALLDSGADLSSITTKVAKHLKLKSLQNTVAVTTFGSSTEQICEATTFTLSSLLKKGWSHQVSAVMVEKITGEHPRQDASLVKDLPALKNLTPADPLFHKPGRIDVLLGADVLPYVQSPSNTSDPPSSIIAVNTVFGHAFMGTYQPTSSTATPDRASIQLVNESAAPATLKHLIKQVAQFWETENPLLMASPYTAEEQRVLQEYSVTHKCISHAGNYQVQLPRRLEKRQLGESKTQAIQRYYQNESSHQKKGTLPQYQGVVKEYIELDHARLCTAEELQLPPSVSYHLPMHGVVKSSSTTTKLRVVFDGSATTTSGWSLNDTLSVGPMLHPKMAEILIRFRKYRIAVTGDISKMYREILLAPAEQQYHRFCWRPTVNEPVKIYCMKRVTFGVTCSPFLAVKTLQQAALDYGGAYPNAQQQINQCFYVDDWLGGADNVQEAKKLQSQIAEILTKAGFTLRKYRSNSKKVIDAIPKELVELLPTKEMVDDHSDSYPKALGLMWDSVKDTMCHTLANPLILKKRFYQIPVAHLTCWDGSPLLFSL